MMIRVLQVMFSICQILLEREKKEKNTHNKTKTNRINDCSVTRFDLFIFDLNSLASCEMLPESIKCHN